MQAENAFCQHAVDDLSLLVGRKLDEALVLMFFNRFTKQLDVGVQNGFDDQQLLRQCQQRRIKIHIGDAIGFFQREHQTFDRLGGDGQVQHLKCVTQLLQ